MLLTHTHTQVFYWKMKLSYWGIVVVAKVNFGVAKKWCHNKIDDAHSF